MNPQAKLRSLRWCDRKKSSSTHLRQISKKRPTVQMKRGLHNYNTDKTLMVWLTCICYPRTFYEGIKLTAGTSSNSLVTWLANGEKVEPKYKLKKDFIKFHNHVFCSWYYSAGEETSRNYQYYYQYMGTLLDSAPEVPEEVNLKCFLLWWLLSKWDGLTNHW
jgi:hypothetical protein